MTIEKESRAAAVKRAALTGTMSSPALDGALMGLRGAKSEAMARRSAGHHAIPGAPLQNADGEDPDAPGREPRSAEAMRALIAALPRGGTAPVGRIGQLLSVDLELQTERPAEPHEDDDEVPAGPRQASHAALLSPRLAHARLANETIEELVIRAIAATHAYDRVHVIAADAREADAIARLIVDMTRSTAVAIDIIDGDA